MVVTATDTEAQNICGASYVKYAYPNYPNYATSTPKSNNLNPSLHVCFDISSKRKPVWEYYDEPFAKIVL